MVWRRAGHGGGFYSGRAAHGGRGAGAPVAVRGRRRPVEGRGYAAGLSGDQAGKVERRGVLGCVRGEAGRPRARSGGARRARHGSGAARSGRAGASCCRAREPEGEGERGGTERPARRGVCAATVPTMATCAPAAVPWRPTVLPADFSHVLERSVIVVRRGVQWGL